MHQLEKMEQSMRFSRGLVVARALAALFQIGRPAVASQDENVFIRNNISSFRVYDWRDRFDSLGPGATISDPAAVSWTNEPVCMGHMEVDEKRIDHLT